VITASSDKIHTTGRWWRWTQTFCRCFYCEKTNTTTTTRFWLVDVNYSLLGVWGEKRKARPGLFGICGWYRGHKTKRFYRMSGYLYTRGPCGDWRNPTYKYLTSRVRNNENNLVINPQRPTGPRWEHIITNIVGHL
jgi:hypothetical protein